MNELQYLIYLEGKLTDCFLSKVFGLLILEQIGPSDGNQNFSKLGSL